MARTRKIVLWFVMIAVTPVVARAQETSPPDRPVEDKPEPPRSLGLPGPVNWTFNFDAGWGTFGFANSLYINSHDPGVPENLSDQWFEGYVKPTLSGEYTLANASEVYGKLSAVGERTYGSVPPVFGTDVGSFGPEDLSIGWRSGKSMEIGENAVDVTIGRTQYRLGRGFLVWDGSAEGGSRGGYWTNARKAFAFAAIGRFNVAPHKVETFYLDKDDLPENDTGSRTWGVNYEYSADKNNTIGATYMYFWAHPDKKPGRNGLNVFNIRAYTAPFAAVPNASLDFEYASERNGDALSSNAWYIEGGYQLSEITWKPKISYRYAFFQGDDPATVKNESFDPLFLGFYDWGTWWQGEIAGEYFLSNSNLKSSLIRLHVTPSEQLSGGLLFFNFHFDQPGAAGPQVTDKDIAFEMDLYADWKLNKNFTISLVGAFADPGKGVQQLTGRTANFGYGMVYVAYSY